MSYYFSGLQSYIVIENANCLTMPNTYTKVDQNFRTSNQTKWNKTSTEFQCFVRSAKFLPQSMVDKMPEEDKEALQLKLGQCPADVMGNNNVQVVEEV